MYFIVLLLVIVLVLFAPQWWANRVLKQYQTHREDFPGTGGEFAQHLLEQLNLQHVRLETTDRGDHYDPIERVVRLGQENFNSKSLTAVTTAAHEIGHALQHQHNYQPLKYRTQLAQIAFHAERIGAILIYAIPLIAIITRVPHTGLLLLLAGIATMGISSVVHLITLPVEFDASFKRALPLLEAGNYLGEKDMRGANKILLACALTYVAASLAGLLNIWRWLTVFRR